MFIQVIQGKASDAEALKGQLDRWGEELASGAEGYLGSTGGVTEDGDFVVLARFESEEAARANSDRPEQGKWWEETSKHLEGEATFRDTDEVETFLDGGSDDAGFVQVIQGRVTDRDRYRELQGELIPKLEDLRTEILGGVQAWDGDFVTGAVYFASEHTAREGEGKALPDDVRAAFEEWQSLVEDPTYFDLTDPWLHAPPSDDDEGEDS